jgi:hypothetical protein
MNQKIKIAFSCNWGQSAFELLEAYRKQTPNSLGIWNNIEGVNNISEADYLIVLSSVGVDQQYTFPKDRTIHFRREPDFIQKFTPLEGIKRVFDYKDNGFHVSTWQYLSDSFDGLVDKPYKPKSKNASTISSPKWQHRNQFLYEAAQQNPGSIDMYGPPIMEQVFGVNYRQLHQKHKNEAIEDYRYSIAIENSQQLNYFTEKINDCYLHLTMPIYWGCPNIGDYFPENSFYLVEMNNAKEIQEILKKPIEEKHIKALLEAKDLVMNKYNIWPVIENIINE